LWDAAIQLFSGVSGQVRPWLCVLPLALVAAFVWTTAFERSLTTEPDAAGEFYWTCRSARGEAQVYRPGARHWTALAPNVALQPNAKVRLGMGGVVLSTPRASVEVQSRTRLLIGDEGLVLLHGALEVQADHKARPLVLQTPQARVTLRHGRLHLDHDPDLGTTVTVVSGLAEAESYGRVIALGQGGSALLPFRSLTRTTSPELPAGHDGPAERRLAQRLGERPLRQQLIRVSVAATRTSQAAEVVLRLPGGDRPSQTLHTVQGDVRQVIDAAFDALPNLDEVDVSSVVRDPRRRYSQWRPVVSVAARRTAHEGATDAPLPQYLARYGRVRYDPTLLRDGAAFPASAVTWRPPDWRQASGRPTTSPIACHSDAGPRIVRAVPARTGHRAVCLTIDDGPRPLITPLTLAALREAHLKATFFLVGRACLQYPELVARILAEGHEIANHSYTHDTIALRDPDRVVQEVRATDDLVFRLTGRHTRFYRPPGGHSTGPVVAAVSAAGYTTALWTCNTGDWAGGPPERIVRRALEGARPGAVILLHQGKLDTVRALPRIAVGLRERDLEPLTLSQACNLPLPSPPGGTATFALLLGGRSLHP